MKRLERPRGALGKDVGQAPPEAYPKGTAAFDTANADAEVAVYRDQVWQACRDGHLEPHEGLLLSIFPATNVLARLREAA